MYTAHHYFDTARGDGDSGGGKYSNTYANEAAHLRDRYPDLKPSAGNKRKNTVRRRRRRREAED